MHGEIGLIRFTHVFFKKKTNLLTDYVEVTFNYHLCERVKERKNLKKD